MVANVMRKVLPSKLAVQDHRKKNVRCSGSYYKRTRTRPEGEDGVAQAWPRPWVPTTTWPPTSRRSTTRGTSACVVPNGDLLHHHIWQGVGGDRRDRPFTETGIRLKSGSELAADIVVTARSQSGDTRRDDVRGGW